MLKRKMWKIVFVNDSYYRMRTILFEIQKYKKGNMMKDDEIVVATDLYLKERKAPTEAELRLYLREVNFHCPICGKELQSRNQKKLSEKKFQIAHIYPNSPTKEQYKTLMGQKRLGDDSESFENKIALCKDCHGTQDYHTTVDDYQFLFNKKKALLNRTALHDATLTLGLENEIEEVVKSICHITDEDMDNLNYNAIPIANKFYLDERTIRAKVTGYVIEYYIYIHDLFNKLDGMNGFSFEILCSQIHACFKKMDTTKASKTEIFDQMVIWIDNKTKNISHNACEAIVSFFVQDCEVFDEITK